MQKNNVLELKTFECGRLQECGDQTREVRTRRVRDVSRKEKNHRRREFV